MPVYVDNKIEDHIAAVTKSNPNQLVFSAKKNIEAVNQVAGKEPGRTAVSQLPGNVMLIEGDFVRGNFVSHYS